MDEKMNRQEPVIRIETPRLVLRNWKEDDILPFATINSNPARLYRIS
jgi:hypothetical protein